ncbi:hypothetical protein BDR03DRAFT_958950 [Suillus americanus]|nr:hypothetical protein BDR03DRAFT_958950 [Suillus americanus]
MSVHGVITNVNWTGLVLTADNDGAKVKVEGKNFIDTDNQRWIGQLKYESSTDEYLTTIQNKASTNYLAVDVQMNTVFMSSSEYWWKLDVSRGRVGFQVPHVQGGSEKGYRTLELEADKSVVLKEVDWHPDNDAQLWTVELK